MKFYDITLINKRLIFFILILSGLVSQAQKTSISPYTRLSIGEIQGANFTRNFAMGGLSYGLSDAAYINPFNPASYTAITWTSFEASAVSRNIWLESGNQTQKGNVTNFDHISIAFPITKWWGAGLSMMPVSKVGYSYKTSSTLVSDYNNIPYDNIFDGGGGLDQAVLTNGIKIKQKLSLGFNFAYYFGKIEHQEVQQFTESDNFNNTAKVVRTEVGGIHLEFGAQYNIKLSKIWNMEVGAVFTPIQGITSNTSDFGFTYTGTSGVPRIIDTITYVENASFSLVLPPKFGVGVLLSNSKRFRIGADIDYTRWSVSNYNVYSGLNDVMSTKVGGEYRFGENGFKLRMGARYGKVPLKIEGTNPDEYAGTLGITLPFRSKDKLTYTEVSFGVEVGQRGKNSGQMLLENFINVNVGLALNNKWFIKRVYD